jgi:hypothetical protein
MKRAFAYLSSVLFLAVVAQVAAAAYGAFNAVDKSDDSGSVSKHAVENGFNAHSIIGTLILVVMLALVIVAAVGKLGQPWLKWAGGLFLLGILQLLLAALGTSVAALGFLHGVNALAIYAASALLAHRAWTVGRGAEKPVETAPA